MVIQLRPHQAEVLDKLKNGTVLLGGVGTGKTVTALAYYWTKVMGGVLNDPTSISGPPMPVYVITTARKRDELSWEMWAARMWLADFITVDSYNNIDKYKEVKDAFFIFDEQRLVGAGAWSKAFIKIALSNQWILLSATPGDVWEDYIPLFIANGWYKNRTEFKRDHCVYSYYGKFPKLERYLNEGKLLRLKRQLLVDMPYERHTTRHIHEVEVDYDRELFDKVVKQRWHVYEDRPLRDVSELFSVMRKVVNSDHSRLTILQQLMQSHPRLIVFYNFDYELEALRTLVQPTKNSTLISQEELSKTARLTTTRSRCCESRETCSCHSNAESLTTSEFSVSSPSTSESSSDLSSRQKMKSSRSSEPLTGRLLGSSAASASTPRTSSGSSITSGGSESRTPERTTSKSITQSIGTGIETELPYTSTAGTTSATTRTSRSASQPAPSSVTIAEWNGHKHEPVPTSERWVYLVQYVAGAEAWDCVDTDTIVFYSLTYSYKNFMQAQGRIDRLNTPFKDLHYYVLLSKSMIDRAVAKSLRGKKNFNERDFGFRAS